MENKCKTDLVSRVPGDVADNSKLYFPMAAEEALLPDSLANGDGRLREEVVDTDHIRTCIVCHQLPI